MIQGYPIIYAARARAAGCDCESLPDLLKSLHRKLNPRRFPGMSPKMTAFVCYMLGMDAMTNPAIVELMRLDDNSLMLRRTGDCGFDHLESWADFARNWNELIKCVSNGRQDDLTEQEQQLARELLEIVEHGTSFTALPRRSMFTVIASSK
jgi:hypothetical protein